MSIIVIVALESSYLFTTYQNVQAAGPVICLPDTIFTFNPAPQVITVNFYCAYDEKKKGQYIIQGKSRPVYVYSQMLQKDSTCYIGLH